MLVLSWALLCLILCCPHIRDGGWLCELEATHTFKDVETEYQRGCLIFLSPNSHTHTSNLCLTLAQPCLTSTSASLPLAGHFCSIHRDRKFPHLQSVCLGISL
jgi:hypothetical protein